MAMYAIALQPLITHLDGFAVQVWYADDASCAGSVADVKAWWDEMVITGGCFGYNVNPRKTWLIVKESQCDVAVEMFKSSSTTHGKRHLGAALGHRSFVEEYVGAQVKEWVEQIHRLAKVAVTQPHTAYSAFVHGLAGRWTFLLRTVPDIEPLLLPLEEAIHHHLIPALTGRDTCGPAERELLSMPIRLGGLGIIDPSKQASHEFSTSTKLSASLVALIMAQDTCYAVDQNDIRKIKADAKAAKRAIQVQRIEELKENFHPALKRAVDLSTEKGASTWLSVLPIDNMVSACIRVPFEMHYA